MKFKSEIVTQVSGSIGGVTYAHNRGGLYRRARSIPTNPNSSRQQVVRAQFSKLSSDWSQLLTNDQREGWISYAANNPIVDRLGDPLVLTGQQMFIRCNSLRLRAGVASVLDGPVTQGMAVLTPPVLVASELLNSLAVTFQGSDPWVSEDGAVLLAFSGRQQSPAINYYRSPMRLAGVSVGDSGTPPVSGSFASPFADLFALGNKVFTYVVVSLADGRISPQVRLSTTIIA